MSDVKEALSPLQLFLQIKKQNPFQREEARMHLAIALGITDLSRESPIDLIQVTQNITRGGGGIPPISTARNIITAIQHVFELRMPEIDSEHKSRFAKDALEVLTKLDGNLPPHVGGTAVRTIKEGLVFVDKSDNGPMRIDMGVQALKFAHYADDGKVGETTMNAQQILATQARYMYSAEPQQTVLQLRNISTTYADRTEPEARLISQSTAAIATLLNDGRPAWRMIDWARAKCSGRPTIEEAVKAANKEAIRMLGFELGHYRQGTSKEWDQVMKFPCR